MDVYMKNLGCTPTSDVVDLEFIMVQIHLINPKGTTTSKTSTYLFWVISQNYKNE